MPCIVQPLEDNRQGPTEGLGRCTEVPRVESSQMLRLASTDQEPYAFNSQYRAAFTVRNTLS